VKAVLYLISASIVYGMLCAEYWPRAIFATILLIVIITLISLVTIAGVTYRVRRMVAPRVARPENMSVSGVLRKSGANGPANGSGAAGLSRNLRWVVLMVAVVAVAGIAYGGLREAMTPHIPREEWFGRSAVFDAQVTQMYENSRGTSTLYLVIHRIGIADVRQQVAIRASWRTSSLTRSVTPGEDIRIAGILGRPPSNTKQTNMFMQLPSYPVSGRLLAVRNEQPWLVRIRDSWLRMGSTSAWVTPGHQQLAASIVFGADNLLPTVKAAFLAAGLMHVLAASGANIVLLEITLEHALHPLWRWLHLPFWLWSLFLVIVIWIFAGMCAFQVSIVRAAVMATYRWVGLAVGKKSSISMSLSAAVFIMGVTAPYSMLTPSAWLSFMATGAIAQSLLKGASARRKTQVPNVVISFAQKGLASVVATIRTTFAVELWVTPLVLALFSQITPYSMLANVLCEPIIAFLLPLSLLWLSLAALVKWIGFVSFAAHLAGLFEDKLVGALERIVESIAAWPGALWTVNGLPGWWILLYYLLLTFVTWALRNWRKFGLTRHVSS
jgi:ComEC/Rec2-related protein